jgi:cytochrome c553
MFSRFSASAAAPQASILATSAVALALLVALFTGAPAVANSKGDAAKGAEKVLACQACHGLNGNSTTPELGPSLAGQNAAYMVEQLKLFRAQHRSNAIMAAQAQALTEDQDIYDIAAYYASQTPVGLEADPSYWKAGEALYRGGDATRGIPACKACHGPVGRGNSGAGYPAVRAQHAPYTLLQLQQYAGAQRYVDPEGKPQKARNSHMMVTISKRLTQEDMRNLASYIQGMR